MQEMDWMSDGLSIAAHIWWLQMMCMLCKQRIQFSLKVEGISEEINAVSPIVLQFQSKHIPNEPIPTDGHSWPQCHRVRLEDETDIGSENAETSTAGSYAMQCANLRPVAE
jgi:hypothetical protein